MNQVSVIFCLFLVLNLPCKCVLNTTDKEKKLFTLFRRQVEEVPDDPTTERSEEDANFNLVAFLVKNAKEIFGEGDDTAFVLTRTTIYPKPTFSSLIYQKITKNITDINRITLNAKTSGITRSATCTKNETSVTTFSLLPFSESNINTKLRFADEYNVTESLETRNKTTSVDIIRSEITTELRDNVESFITPQTNYTTEETIIATTSTLKMLNNFILDPIVNDVVTEKKITLKKRTCIMCNNIHIKECNDPNQKFVPTVICDREEDVCYSQQTPFGLIDRGCFNTNLNMTTYVCSCNLCNYISISEMPFIFSKRREWVDNIIDLSRANGLRSSIYKDMSCLSCEVNTTAKSFDLMHNTNCLEGNIGVLPTQHCADDEICGIKALRSDGYIWRGCLKSPLYNYWWSLCDSDLCNFDAVVSIYDQT